jgi:hypothetical protein
MLELITGWDTNWHSILEQTYGLINGLGIGLAMLPLVLRSPRVSDDPPVRRWTDWFAPAVVLLLVTYLNARKNPEEWVKAHAMLPMMYWFQPITWFNIGYLLLAAAVVYLMIEHMRRPLPVVPASWLGKGQLLYLVLLWWVIVFNFERALVSFASQRLVTEGVLHVNAVLVTLLVVLWSRVHRKPTDEPPSFHGLMPRIAGIGMAAIVVCVVGSWGIARAVFGSVPLRFRGTPAIRFGPRATAHDAITNPAAIRR